MYNHRTTLYASDINMNGYVNVRIIGFLQGKNDTHYTPDLKKTITYPQIKITLMQTGIIYFLNAIFHEGS